MNFWFCLLCSANPIETTLEVQSRSTLCSFQWHSFCIGEKRSLDCQYSKRYYKTKEHSSNRVYLQGTWQMGCKAHIEITEYIIYPDYKVNTGKEGRMSNKAIRGMKEKDYVNLGMLLKGEEVLCQPSHCWNSPPKKKNNIHNAACQQLGWEAMENQIVQESLTSSPLGKRV